MCAKDPPVWARNCFFFLEHRAAEMGYDALLLSTRLVNQGAVSFYERNGYLRIPNYGRYQDRPEAVGFENMLLLE